IARLLTMLFGLLTVMLRDQKQNGHIERERRLNSCCSFIPQRSVSYSLVYNVRRIQSLLIQQSGRYVIAHSNTIAQSNNEAKGAAFIIPHLWMSSKTSTAVYSRHNVCLHKYSRYRRRRICSAPAYCRSSSSSLFWKR
uniref:Secreted protein n=1 Tax=Parascaris univalens TaxID=6257 RepID=A0A915CJS9_PARUN